jgi:hypothetical protein
MPTWPEVQNYVRTKYKLFKDEPERFAVMFKESETRSQIIWVRPFKAYNQDFIEFKSYFCKETEMAPLVGMRKNAEVTIGFIALVGEHYALIWNVPMKSMDVEEFDLPLNVVASRADELERLYSAGKDDYLRWGLPASSTRSSSSVARWRRWRGAGRPKTPPVRRWTPALPMVAPTPASRPG